MRHEHPPVSEDLSSAKVEERSRRKWFGAGRSRSASPADWETVGRQGVLAVHHLGKGYRGRMVVQDVSISVRRGEAVGLLGPNGAGKTTVFYMITGLVKPDKGLIELDGHDVTGLPMYRRARLGIGYLPQEASIFRGLSVEDNIRAVLEIAEPDGERRRCEIARSLASNPSFMLLDEPFAGIDPIAVGDIQDLVRHLKKRS